MKTLLIVITTMLLLSCNQVLVREYESPLDPSFFRNADCQKTAQGSFIYTKGNISYELDESKLIRSENGKVVWEKSRSKILYPYGYLDLAVPYMLRDGMSTEKILEILGKESRNNKRFFYYDLSNGSELVLFKGTLNMPIGMKSLIIQGLDYKDDIKMPNLNNN